MQPGQTVKLNCQATDPDGDAVTYRWTAPQGTFNPAENVNPCDALARDMPQENPDRFENLIKKARAANVPISPEQWC